MQPYLIKYGTAVTIPGFKLKAAEAENYQVNPTLATGDVKIEKDGGASTDLNTLPSVAPAGGTSVSITISATEAQCARGVVTFVDASGAEWSDDSLVFMTYGHASAAIKADLSDDVRLGLTALPNVQAGSNGGLPLVVGGSGEVPANVTSMASAVLTEDAIAVEAITAAKFASGAFDAVWTVSTRTLTSFGSLVSDIATAVWGAGTRILTAGTNIVLAKGTGVTGFNDLSAAQVNAEVDTALADYDAPTNAEMTARTLAAADYATAANQSTLLTRVGVPAASVAADIAAVKSDTASLLTRIPAALFTGITSLAGWLRLLGRKANTNATALSEMNADAGDGVGTYLPSTDSNEAIRDRGDAAWASVGVVLARIVRTIDDANDQDEYTVQWYRDANDGNGLQVVTSGVTVPTIRVVKHDGDELIAETAMVAADAEGMLTYDATGDERLAAGEAVKVVVEATIGGSPRAWAELIETDAVEGIESP